jgi:hypothetical protein
MPHWIRVGTVPDKVQAVVIRGALNATDALCVVASLTGDVEARVEKEILYPYHCFDADCSIPTLVGRKRLTMLCLVDAINGLGATADNFELKSESVRAASLLESEIDQDAAGDIAHRTVTHRLGRKLRTISTFDVALAPRGIVHKRFWIVRTSDARVMVDSTSGGLHPLKLRAA